MPKAGINLLDLLPVPQQVNVLIPQEVRNFFEKLTIVEHRSITSEDTHIHYGVVQSLEEVGISSLKNWPIKIPGLNRGLKFRLLLKRKDPEENQNLESSPDEFKLDLFLDRFLIGVPWFTPAQLIDPTVGPAYLVKDPRRENVYLYGSGVLRIESDPESDIKVSIRLIDWPDPFDPDAPTGCIFNAGFDPPHFLIGDSKFGFTVDELVIDVSEKYTPPEIVARGHDASWRGLAIQEATFYCPPIVKNLAAGVRNFLIGDPFGLQGEVHIELGRLDPGQYGANFITFKQKTEETEEELQVISTDIERSYKVLCRLDAKNEAYIRSSFSENVENVEAEWILPNRKSIKGKSTAYFKVREGDVLRVYPTVTLEDNTKVKLPEFVYVFKKKDGVSDTNSNEDSNQALQHAPKIKLTLSNGITFENVVHISGAREFLNNLTFEADPSAEDLKWRLIRGKEVLTESKGSSFSLNQIFQVDTFFVVLESKGKKRRVEIEVLSEGKLVIGCESGAFTFVNDKEQVEVLEIEKIYDLDRFHQDGEKFPSTKRASLEDNSLIISEGALVEVILKLGTPHSPDESPNFQDPQEIRHAQIFMLFDSVESNSQVNTTKAYKNKEEEIKFVNSKHDLQEWVKSFDENTKFVVIGRCCNCGSQEYNQSLATRRAKTAQKIIEEIGVSSDRICAIGEQSNDCSGFDLTSIPHGQWLILQEQEGFQPIVGGCKNREEDPLENIRKLYRRVDIHAIGGQARGSGALSSQDEEKRAPSLRRIMIPGEDLTEIKPVKPRESTLPWECHLKIVWDSPTAVEWRDAIPTLFELTIRWQSKELSFPTSNGNKSVTPSTEIFTLVLRWSYDAITGKTLITGSLESSGDPDGLFKLSEPHLSGALALAPALVAGIEAVNDEGDAVSLAALLTAAVAATVFAGEGSNTVVKKVEIEYEAPNIASPQDATARFLCDYTVELHVDLKALNSIGIKTKKPIKIGYKRVGIEYTYNEEKPWYEGFNLVYEDVSIEIEDPGQWEITGPLGQLLRVTAARAGSGSTWYELDLAFALDLGVISISGATIRITFNGSDIDLELRGLAVGVDIPGTLKGEGRMALDSDGTVRAGLDLEIIPANIKGKGSLALNPDYNFVAIYAGVIFATGIPLASTGLGIFGFEGRFVSNGTRDFSSITSDDPVQKEIDWYLLDSEKQYTSQLGQWALGLGTVVGTLPDTGFTFNANGAFVVEFPDPSVILGITAKFASKPSFEKEKTNLLGIISINPEALILGIKGSYKIEKLLQLEVPVSGYFPFPNTKDFYLRIGADGYEGRTGDPVTLIFLPGILDAKAWSYLMIEERQLHKLGGKEDFSFDGFSIGYGCGWDIKWKAGPIKLEATSELLVGLGTNPFILKGGIWVKGELSLVVVSISAKGEIIIQIFEAGDDLLHRLSGKFCGKVDLFLFSIEGCVSIEIGDKDFKIPPPPSPLKGIDLTDRRGTITGKAKKDGENGEGAQEFSNTVWPDTVPVLHFAHHLVCDLSNAAFDVPNPPAGEIWFGSGDTKYAYRLVDIQIIPINDDGTPGNPLDGSFEAVWWWPTHRSGVLNSEDPETSEHEGLDLALFSWHPAPWARNLLDGASEIPGDPVLTIDEICNPSLEPKTICVLGRNAERFKVDRVRLKPDGRKEPPLASYFEIIGQEYFYSFDLETLRAFVLGQGLQIVRGKVSSIPVSFETMETSINKIFELPYLAFQDQFLTTLHFKGLFSPAVEQPDLVLVLHEKRDEAGICEEFSDIRRGTKLPPVFRHGPFLYESLNNESVGRIYNGHLMFNKKGIRITLPYPVESVEVTLFQDSPRRSVVIKAFDIRGKKVGQSQGEERGKFSCKLKGSLIHEITIEGGGGESRLLQLCFQELEFPEVIGLSSDGKEYSWKPELLLKQGSCRFVRYRPQENGYWKAFRINPWAGSHLGIVSSCALSWVVAEKHRTDQQARKEFVEQWNERAQGEDPSEHCYLLEPDREYQIKITWQWQVWTKSEDGDTPPPPQDDKWSNPIEERYVFRTAPKGEITPGTTPDFTKETVFDPRGILRYLIKIEPEDGSAFHFLDDPIRVHFQIDYIEQLLSLYGYELAFRLRRTDPPVGSLKDQEHPSDIPLVVEWQPLAEEFWDLSDRRILEAVRQSPCLEEIPLGGKTAEIYAELEPNAEYDLMLLACSEEEEILLTRTHFRTSRYRNPSEMIEDLGFSKNGPDPIYPWDVVLEEDSQVPSDEILESDCEFEEALRNLELDPWPLSRSARTIALWKNNNGNWTLQGLLLESLEPLFRRERVKFQEAFIKNTNGNQIPLSLVRSNTSNTHLLLVPPTPSELNGEEILHFSWLENGQVVTASKYLRNAPGVF